MKKDVETMLPLILKAIEEKNGKVRVYPRGKSMLPMIREGIDSVVLVKPDSVNLYDIVLYKSNDGKYSLHRIVRFGKGRILVSGDNQSAFECICKDKIVAKVESWYRGEKKIGCDDKKYIEYVKRINFTRPFRRIKRKVINMFDFYGDI